MITRTTTSSLAQQIETIASGFWDYDDGMEDGLGEAILAFIEVHLAVPEGWNIERMGRVRKDFFTHFCSTDSKLDKVIGRGPDWHESFAHAFARIREVEAEYATIQADPDLRLWQWNLDLARAVRRTLDAGWGIEREDETYSMAASCQARWSRTNCWLHATDPDGVVWKLNMSNTKTDQEIIEWLDDRVQIFVTATKGDAPLP